ncbi:RCC1 domain-containing protein [Paenibacillus puerhi]|uniref:RCC1 domain-containing protein n=1 Tax=Paenibacillus puerhi TaxID=2692622 RepID=UPI00135C015A|nr:RCC1 domain-containing protein [Paenibacillus puerhi]
MNEGYPEYISGVPVPASSSKPITGLEHVKSIAAGSNHLLALTQDGKVLSFGSNMYGQLGQGADNADRLHPIGTWSGLDAMFPSYGRTYAIKDGDLWVMKDGGATQAVLLGQKAFKVVEALGHYAVLTEDGRLLVPDPEEAKSCKVIQAPGPVKDVSATMNGILVALMDGRVYYVQGYFTSLDAEVELKFEPKPKGNSVQVTGDPIPFVLTDQGELYYKERTEDGKPLMKLVNTEAPLKRWSPAHYVFFDGIGYVGKALDTNGQVIDIEVSLQRDGHVENEKAAVKSHPTGRKAVVLTGGAEIGADGRIFDGNNRIRSDAAMPEGEKLHAYASLYHFPIEGRSYFRHIFITDKGTIYWLGDLPVSYWRPTAKEVTVRN